MLIRLLIHITLITLVIQLVFYDFDYNTAPTIFHPPWFTLNVSLVVMAILLVVDYILGRYFNGRNDENGNLP